MGINTSLAIFGIVALLAIALLIAGTGPFAPLVLLFVGLLAAGAVAFRARERGSATTPDRPPTTVPGFRRKHEIPHQDQVRRERGVLFPPTRSE